MNMNVKTQVYCDMNMNVKTQVYCDMKDTSIL